MLHSYLPRKEEGRRARFGARRPRTQGVAPAALRCHLDRPGLLAATPALLEQVLASPRSSRTDPDDDDDDVVDVTSLWALDVVEIKVLSSPTPPCAVTSTDQLCRAPRSRSPRKFRLEAVAPCVVDVC
jgi:hypothetical protein